MAHSILASKFCFEFNTGINAEYIKEKYFKGISDDDLDIYFHSLEFYNFRYLPVNFIDEFNLFYHLCKFDHYPIVELLLGHKKLNINDKHI